MFRPLRAPAGDKPPQGRISLFCEDKFYGLFGFAGGTDDEAFVVLQYAQPVLNVGGGAARYPRLLPWDDAFSIWEIMQLVISL